MKEPCLDRTAGGRPFELCLHVRVDGEDIKDHADEVLVPLMDNKESAHGR